MYLYIVDTQTRLTMIKVKVRSKKVSGGRKSLYLDYYPACINPETGKMGRREFLGLYILEEVKTSTERKANRQNIEMAERVRQQREHYVNRMEAFTDEERERFRIKQAGQRPLLDYFTEIAAQKRPATKLNYETTIGHLRGYAPADFKINQLNEGFCKGFIDYLSQTVGAGGLTKYTTIFKAVIKQAYKSELIHSDLSLKVDKPKYTPPPREYLTADELNRLAAAPCADSMIKKAALFSALTGLRWSDVINITWNHVKRSENGVELVLTMKKTGAILTLPISKQAFRLLGEVAPLRLSQLTPAPNGSERLNIAPNNHQGVPKGESKCFPLKYTCSVSYKVGRWAKAAGLSKRITFHCFRHTFATLQLNAGTDIYTVSKMLGHSNLTTTQVYAKIVDKTKREAAERIQIADFEI